jgi:hypothetical protein
MNATTTTNDLPEQSLRCEYCILVFGRFVEVVCLKGGFDMPLALGKGPLGGSFYLTRCLEMGHKFVLEPVSTAVREFCEAWEKDSDNNPAPHSKDQPVETSKPLHEKVHQDDLRLESSIRVFGRNIEVLAQNGDFTMPGALKGCHYQSQFNEIFRGLVVAPALSEVRQFFEQRELARENEERQRTKETFVDEQAWNFGSENLTSAMQQEKQEQPAQREAA